jgi:hypothetical protein
MDELNTNATIVSDTNQWLPHGIHDKCTHQSLVLRSINDPYAHGLQRDMSMHRVIKYLVGLHASGVHQLTSVGRQNITKSDLLHTAFFLLHRCMCRPSSVLLRAICTLSSIKHIHQTALPFGGRFLFTLSHWGIIVSSSSGVIKWSSGCERVQ